MPAPPPVQDSLLPDDGGGLHDVNSTPLLVRQFMLVCKPVIVCTQFMLVQPRLLQLDTLQDLEEAATTQIQCY